MPLTRWYRCRENSMSKKLQLGQFALQSKELLKLKASQIRRPVTIRPEEPRMRPRRYYRFPSPFTASENRLIRLNRESDIRDINFQFFKRFQRQVFFSKIVIWKTPQLKIFPGILFGIWGLGSFFTIRDYLVFPSEEIFFFRVFLFL